MVMIFEVLSWSFEIRSKKTQVKPNVISDQIKEMNFQKIENNREMY